MELNERYAMLVKDLQQQGVTIESKESRWYWKALAFILKVLSFGKIEFMKNFSTTTGAIIGVPADWDTWDLRLRYEVLKHESKHIEQYKRFGFGNIWFGAIVVGIAYAFLPFPIGLAYCRAMIEREGYAESMRVIVQLDGPDAARAAKSFFVSQYTGPNYLWMWPFKSQVEKWVDDDLARIIAEESA